MHLTAIIPCVNYADYLQLTLPAATRFADKVLVVTSLADRVTPDIAADHGVDCVATDEWYKNGSVFNKGAALNRAIAVAAPKDWILLMDADILLMPPPDNWHVLHKKMMYGVRRRDIGNPEQWQRCLDGCWYDMPYIPLPPIKRTPKGLKVWAYRKSGNPIAMQGYFQLWHWRTNPHTLKEHHTAAVYDSELAERWPDHLRHFVPWTNYSVMHMGQARVNWEGRTTEHWAVTPPDLEAIEVASAAWHADPIPPPPIKHMPLTIRAAVEGQTWHYR